MRIRSFVAGGAIIAAGAFGIAGSAMASTSGHHPYPKPTSTQTVTPDPTPSQTSAPVVKSVHVNLKASTKVSGDPDSGTKGDNWANDGFTLDATVTGGTSVALSNCGITTGTCYSFTGSEDYNGTAVVIKGALSPGQGKVEARSASARMTGGSKKITFYASTVPGGRYAPPRTLNDHKKTATGEHTSGTWLEQFFGPSTKFGTFTFTAEGWTYTLPRDENQTAQKWVDSAADNWGTTNAGDIVTVALHHRGR